MPQDGGCRLRLLVEDVGSSADKRQSAHQLWIWCLRMGHIVDNANGRLVNWLDSQSELLLGMSILEGLKQRGSSLIQSSKHLEKSCTHPVQVQYHAQRIQRSGNHVDTSGECMHAQTNQINVKTAAKATKDVSMPKNKAKLLNSLVGVKTWCIGEVDGSGSHANASTIRTDM